MSYNINYLEEPKLLFRVYPNGAVLQVSPEEIIGMALSDVRMGPPPSWIDSFWQFSREHQSSDLQTRQVVVLNQAGGSQIDPNAGQNTFSLMNPPPQCFRLTHTREGAILERIPPTEMPTGPLLVTYIPEGLSPQIHWEMPQNGTLSQEESL